MIGNMLSEIRNILFDRETYNLEIYKKYSDCLSSFNDLLGDGYTEPSLLFYLINRNFLYMLDNDPKISITEKDIIFRRKFNEILQKYGHLALKCSQKFEDRNFLNLTEEERNANVFYEKDKGVILPNKPVIYVANHAFYDDMLATVLAAKRHAYIYLGSLPEFYNTVNGIALYLVGDVLMNRKVKESKDASMEKSARVMELGSDMIIFPEGGWNKSCNVLTLPLWRGVYRLSKMTGADVVPIVHYVRDMEILDKKNVIHTVVDDPIPLYKMEREEALEKLRDVITSWQYKMMEVYGKSTREEELKGYATSQEAWDAKLEERMKGVARYDSSVERQSDYRDKSILRPGDVFEPIANIKNITSENIGDVVAAKKLVLECKRNDFQRRY